VPALEHGADHLPGGGFADAAGDRHDAACEPVAIPSSKFAERVLGILDFQRPGARRGLCHSSFLLYFIKILCKFFRLLSVIDISSCDSEIKSSVSK
jgi:hypothetical protein